jgi:hypothetical protein
MKTHPKFGIGFWLDTLDAPEFYRFVTATLKCRMLIPLKNPLFSKNSNFDHHQDISTVPEKSPMNDPRESST